MQITLCQPEDLPQVRALFRHTVQTINAKDYNPQQIQVWSSSADEVARWEDRLATQHFLIAKTDNQVVGFGTMKPDGYLDTLFVHHHFQRKGIAQALLNELIEHARSQNVGVVWSDVSITARPFFDKNGFVVERVQRKIYKETAFTNFIVYKKLVEPLLETE